MEDFAVVRAVNHRDGSFRAGPLGQQGRHEVDLVFVGDRDSVPRGAIAAYGLDYFLVGYEAGKKAAQILKGKNPGEIPAGQATKFTLWINLKAAKIQGVKVPKELLDKADKVWGENGKVIKGS